MLLVWIVKAPSEALLSWSGNPPQRAFSELLSPVPFCCILHRSNHTLILLQNLICGECGDEFVLQSQLSAHLEEHRKELSGVKVYTCKACRKEFPTSAQLKEHMRSHVRMRWDTRRWRPMDKKRALWLQSLDDKVKVFLWLSREVAEESRIRLETHGPKHTSDP